MIELLFFFALSIFWGGLFLSLCFKNKGIATADLVYSIFHLLQHAAMSQF